MSEKILDKILWILNNSQKIHLILLVQIINKKFKVKILLTKIANNKNNYNSNLLHQHNKKIIADKVFFKDKIVKIIQLKKKKKKVCTSIWNLSWI